MRIRASGPGLFNPYQLDPIKDDPVSEAERDRKIRELQDGQARSLREKLGDTLYDWLDSFDDTDFLPQD